MAFAGAVEARLRRRLPCRRKAWPASDREPVPRRRAQQQQQYRTENRFHDAAPQKPCPLRPGCREPLGGILCLSNGAKVGPLRADQRKGPVDLLSPERRSGARPSATRIQARQQAGGRPQHAFLPRANMPKPNPSPDEGRPHEPGQLQIPQNPQGRQQDLCLFQPHGGGKERAQGHFEAALFDEGAAGKSAALRGRQHRHQKRHRGGGGLGRQTAPPTAKSPFGPPAC